MRALGAATEVVVGAGGPTVDAAALTTIGTACRDRETLRFGYRGRDGERSRRVVEPHALLVHGRRWYLLAFDPSRTGWRTFRVDRIERPAPAGQRFVTRNVPGGDPAAYLTRALQGAVYRHEVRVRFHAPAAQVRTRLPGVWGALREERDGTCVYETSDDDLDWLAVRVSMPMVEFELLEAPPELRERLVAMGQRIVRSAEPPPSSARPVARD